MSNMFIFDLPLLGAPLVFSNLHFVKKGILSLVIKSYKYNLTPNNEYLILFQLILRHLQIAVWSKIGEKGLFQHCKGIHLFPIATKFIKCQSNFYEHVKCNCEMPNNISRNNPTHTSLSFLMCDFLSFKKYISWAK